MIDKELMDEKERQRIKITISWFAIILMSILIFSSFVDFINIIFNESQNLLIYLLYLCCSIIFGMTLGYFLKKLNSYSIFISIGGILFVICEILRETWILLLFCEFLLFFAFIINFYLYENFPNKTEVFWNKPLLVIAISLGLFLPSVLIDPNTFKQMFFIFLTGFMVIIGMNSWLLYIELNNTDIRDQEKIRKKEERLNEKNLKTFMISLSKAIIILSFIIISVICASILFYVVYDILIRSFIFYSIFGTILIDIFIIQSISKKAQRTKSRIIFLILINISLVLFTFLISIVSGFGYMICIYQVIISVFTLIIITI